MDGFIFFGVCDVWGKLCTKMHIVSHLMSQTFDLQNIITFSVILSCKFKSKNMLKPEFIIIS